MAITFSRYNDLNNLECGTTSLKFYSLSSGSPLTTLSAGTGSTRGFNLPSTNASNAPGYSVYFNGIQVLDEPNSWVMVTQNKVFNYSSINYFVTAFAPESGYSSGRGVQIRTSPAHWAEVISGQQSLPSPSTTSGSFTVRFKSSNTTLQSIVLTPVSDTSSLPSVDIKVYSYSKSGDTYTINYRSTGYSGVGMIFINYLVYGGC